MKINQEVLLNTLLVLEELKSQTSLDRVHQKVRAHWAVVTSPQDLSKGMDYFDRVYGTETPELNLRFRDGGGVEVEYVYSCQDLIDEDDVSAVLSVEELTCSAEEWKNTLLPRWLENALLRGLLEMTESADISLALAELDD
jgi:hypothetical protein